MRKVLLGALLAAVIGAVAAISAVASADTIHGTAIDQNAQGLGEITYVFNPSGYQFWFTATADVGTNYVAGHSYHNVYKYDVNDPTDWCGPVTIPDRPPYNAAGTDGRTAYYKIWDVTTETAVCGVFDSTG